MTHVDLLWHGRVWAILDPPPRSREAASLEIQASIEDGAMDPVWMRAGA